MTPRDITEAEFQAAVLERSREVLVLVDFWAAWCGPCKALAPVLEKVVEEFGDRIELVKVDTDKEQRLAAAVQIQSLPTVMLFKDGRPIDAFMGAQPEAEIRAFLRRHLPATADDVLAEVQTALEAGDVRTAKALIAPLFQGASVLPAAHLLRARIGLRDGEPDVVRDHVAQLDANTAEGREGAHLLDALTLIEGSTQPPVADLEQVEDVASLMAIGAGHIASGRYEDALEAFLEVVRRDRRFDEEAGRRAMLTVFGVLGSDHDLTRSYRRRLMIIL